MKNIYSRQRLTLWTISLLFLCTCGIGNASVASGGQIETPESVLNLVGTNFLNDKPGVENTTAKVATVLVFVKHDCPIANSYVPTLNRIQNDFKPHGIRFLMVYPSPMITTEIARSHANDFSIEIPGILDPTLAIASVFDAKVTPEVVVVDQTGKPLYRGRIDDKYVGFGKRRPTPTRHDLREALDDVVAKRPVQIPATKPLGCIIPRFASPSRQRSDDR